MFTATEENTLLRLLAAVNAVVNTPEDEPVDREVRVELEHARTATAALFADYVDSTAEKLDKRKDAMHKAWESFVPERRKSYGPIFEAAGVRPEAEQDEAEEAEFEPSGLLTAPTPLLEAGKPEAEVVTEQDEFGRDVVVEEPDEVFDPEEEAPNDIAAGSPRRRRKPKADTPAGEVA